MAKFNHKNIVRYYNSWIESRSFDKKIDLINTHFINHTIPLIQVVINIFYTPKNKIKRSKEGIPKKIYFHYFLQKNNQGGGKGGPPPKNTQSHSPHPISPGQ